MCTYSLLNVYIHILWFSFHQLLLYGNFILFCLFVQVLHHEMYSSAFTSLNLPKQKDCIIKFFSFRKRSYRLSKIFVTLFEGSFSQGKRYINRYEDNTAQTTPTCTPDFFFGCYNFAHGVSNATKDPWEINVLSWRTSALFHFSWVHLRPGPAIEHDCDN